MNKASALSILVISLAVGLIAGSLLTGFRALTGEPRKALSSDGISALPAVAEAGLRASVGEPKGTLNPDNPLAVYEITLEKGYVKFNISLVNKGPTILSVDVGIDLWAEAYVPWLGEEVEFWHPYRYEYVWIGPGEDWSWTPEMLIIEGGSARVVISPRPLSPRLYHYSYETSFKLDYNIEVKYMAREADYEPLRMNTTTSYTWSKAAEDVVVFKVDVPSDRLLNIIVKQTIREVAVPVVRATLRVWTSGLDEGDEEIEVYLNDRYVGAVDEELDEIRLPVEYLKYGYNELKFVYRELTAEADYLYLEEWEVELLYADGMVECIHALTSILMEDDGDTWTDSFYAGRKRDEAYYRLCSLANGLAFGEFYIFGNRTGSIYAYLPKGSYCLIAQRDFATDVWLSITIEQPPIEVITPDGSVEFTFHKYGGQAFFVGVKPDADWIYQLELEITHGDGWWAHGSSTAWAEFSLDHFKSLALEEEVRGYIDTLWAFPMEFTTFETLTCKSPEAYWGFYGESREEYFSPSGESYHAQPVRYQYVAPLIVFRIGADPYGPSATDTCTVEVRLTKKEKIPELSVGSRMTASFNTTKGPVTAVFKLSVDVGSEYTVRLEPTRYERYGSIYGTAIVPTTKYWWYWRYWWYWWYWRYWYWQYWWLWPSYSANAVNTTLTLEIAGQVATTAYLYIEAGGDTSEMTVELVGVSEAEPLAGETTIAFSGDDRMKLMKFDVKEGFTYRLEAELLRLGRVVMTFFDSNGTCVWELERKPPSRPPSWKCGYGYSYPYYVLKNLKSKGEGTAYLIIWGSPGAELRVSITEEEKPYEEGLSEGYEEGLSEGYEGGYKEGLFVGLAGGVPGGIAVGAIAMWVLVRRRKAGSPRPP